MTPHSVAVCCNPAVSIIRTKPRRSTVGVVRARKAYRIVCHHGPLVRVVAHQKRNFRVVSNLAVGDALKGADQKRSGDGMAWCDPRDLVEDPQRLRRRRRQASQASHHVVVWARHWARNRGCSRRCRVVTMCHAVLEVRLGAHELLDHLSPHKQHKTAAAAGRVGDEKSQNVNRRSAPAPFFRFLPSASGALWRSQFLSNHGQDRISKHTTAARLSSRHGFNCPLHLSRRFPSPPPVLGPSLAPVCPFPALAVPPRSGGLQSAPHIAPPSLALRTPKRRP